MTSSVPSLLETRADRLERAVHVGLDDDRQLPSLAGLELREHVLSEPRPPVADTCAWSRRLRWRYSVISRARFSFSTTASRSPGSGTPSRPRISTGIDGPAVLDRLRRVVEQRAHAAPLRRRPRRCRRPSACRAAPAPSRPAPRPRSSLASMIVPCGLALGVGLQVEQLGLQLDRLDQLVEVDPLGGADRDLLHVAAEVLHHDLVAAAAPA